VTKKAARRKPAKKSPQVSAKPLRELWERLSGPGDRSRLTMMVSSPFQWVPGVPLPPDLEEACRFFAREETRVLVDLLSNPPATRVDPLLDEYEQHFDPIELDEQHVWEMQYAIKKALRIGFNLALLRYADELNHIPEAAAMLEQKRAAAKKGGDARRREAEPRKQQARRLDRELRKEGGLMRKKTYRIERIAHEMKKNTRTIQRYLDRKRDKK